MLVVSDATPINGLVRLRVVDVLRELYGQVVIPTAVEAELSHPNTPVEVRNWLSSTPTWLAVKKPLHVDPAIVSGAGEREAIALALELEADFLLVDDKEARVAARRLRIPVTGTIGVLELAAVKGLIDLPTVLTELAPAGFFIDPEVVRRVLERDADRRRTKTCD
jgi:predicted nucleic acid-binding protein